MIIKFKRALFLLFMVTSILPVEAGKIALFKALIPTKHLPTIEVSYKKGTSMPYKLTSQFLRAKPYVELYDKKICNEKNISLQNFIAFRDENVDRVNREELTDLLEQLIIEINEGKKEFTNFFCITDATFNWHLKAGALILKFKDYPFVAKIFIETPYSLTHPFNMGIEAYILFRMGGGITRHLSGFTRLTNHERIQTLIKNHNLQKLLQLPRKWFWKPENINYLHIKGSNFGGDKNAFEIDIPSIYAIIADAINPQSSFSLFNAHDRTKALKIFNDLGNIIDPNPNNFMFEENSDIPILIDTEYWPALIGVTQQPNVTSYLSYYCKFGLSHCIRNFLFGMQDKNGNAFESK